MVSVGAILFVVGLGLLLFVADLFGYSKTVKSDVENLKNTPRLTEEERRRGTYFRWTAYAKTIGGLAMLAGIVILSIGYFLGKN